MNMEVIGTTKNQCDLNLEKKKKESLRTEIDTSAPFESVKEAVDRFGGVGYWKPLQNKTSFLNSNDSEHHIEDLDGEKLEEQARLLEKELNLKERETLDVLKDLESTKRILEDLKSKLQKVESEMNLNLQTGKEEKNNQATWAGIFRPVKEGYMPGSLSSAGLILMELKKAKLNISKTTNDLAEIRATSDLLNEKLEKERMSIEKTRERLTENSSKIYSLEEELNKTRLRLQVTKDAQVCDPSEFAIVLQQLSSKAEHFREMRESAKSEALKTMSEIEQTKAMIITADLRLVAARKMKDAARAAQTIALAEINALTNREGNPNREEITLSFEEYTALTCKAREAEEQYKKRVADAMLEVDAANFSQMDIIKRVEEATEEIKTSKKALEEALERVEAADRGKLEVEEALRKWRSEGHKRRSSMQNSTKFKNSGPSEYRKDFKLLDVNGLNIVNDESKAALKPTLSIGQILSRKLLKPEELEAGTMSEESISVKRKVSLGQMLGKHNDYPLSDEHVEKENGQKQFSAKRKKFGFGKFSLLLSKQQKKQKKKKPTLNLR